MKMEAVREEVSPHNPWWTTAEKPTVLEDLGRSDYKYHFDILVESRRRLLVLSGRKGIGKTNTVHRLISDLLDEEDVEPQDILYFPLDDPSYQQNNIDTGSIITDVVDWYRQKVHRDSDRHQFVFLDDVHSIGEEEWRDQVAEILDTELDIHVVVTTVHGDLEDLGDELGEDVPPPHMLPRKFFDHAASGASPHIDLGSQEDVDALKQGCREARRSVLRSVDSGEPELIRDAFADVASRIGDVDMERAIDEYERRNLDTEVPEDRTISDQLELTIYKEMPRVQGFRNVVGAHSLCKYVAETPSEYVSYSELESELGIESRLLKSYVDALSDFYLVNPVYPFNYSVRRNFRLYLQNPSYAYTFSRTEERVSDHKVRETVALDHLKRLSFYFHSRESPYTVTTGGKIGQGTDAYNFRRDIDFVFNYYPDLSKTPGNQPDLSDAGAEITVPTGSGGDRLRAASIPVNVSGSADAAAEMESTIERINQHSSDPNLPVGILLTDDAEPDEVRVHDRVVEIPRGLFSLTC